LRSNLFRFRRSGRLTALFWGIFRLRFASLRYLDCGALGMFADSMLAFPADATLAFPADLLRGCTQLIDLRIDYTPAIHQLILPESLESFLLDVRCEYVDKNVIHLPSVPRRTERLVVLYNGNRAKFEDQFKPLLAQMVSSKYHVIKRWRLRYLTDGVDVGLSTTHIKSLYLCHQIFDVLTGLQLPQTLTALTAPLIHHGHPSLTVPLTTAAHQSKLDLTHLINLKVLRLFDIGSMGAHVEVMTPSGLQHLAAPADIFHHIKDGRFNFPSALSPPIYEIVLRAHDMSRYDRYLRGVTKLVIDCAPTGVVNYTYLPPSVTELELDNVVATSLVSIDFPRHNRIKHLTLIKPAICDWEWWSNGPVELERLDVTVYWDEDVKTRNTQLLHEVVNVLKGKERTSDASKRIIHLHHLSVVPL
jgi:hypothetical protein